MNKENFDGLKHELVSLKSLGSHVSKEDILFLLGEVLSLVESMNDEIEKLELDVERLERRVSELERELDK
ncbi:MAG: hypothetical protein IPK80_02180 [Nannocystis sp.]|nr:hypothetical protein [Nannocystis sp.]